jgi:hypothetical protein
MNVFVRVLGYNQAYHWEETGEILTCACERTRNSKIPLEIKIPKATKDTSQMLLQLHNADKGLPDMIDMSLPDSVIGRLGLKAGAMLLDIQGDTFNVGAGDSCATYMVVEMIAEKGSKKKAYSRASITAVHDVIHNADRLKDTIHATVQGNFNADDFLIADDDVNRRGYKSGDSDSDSGAKGKTRKPAGKSKKPKKRKVAGGKGKPSKKSK